jgi:transposase
MTQLMPKDEILKTDAMGRVRTPVKRREALLDEFERSGVSAKKFAVLVGIKHQTFAAWVTHRRKLRTKGCVPAPATQPPAVPERSAPKLQWVEAVVERDALTPSQKGENLSVHLPGGARMEVSEGRQVALAAELLKALAGQGVLPC